MSVWNPYIGPKNWTVAILFAKAIDFVTAAPFVGVGVFVILGVGNTGAALANLLVQITGGQTSLLSHLFLLVILEPLGVFLAVAFTGGLGLLDGGGDLLGVTLGGDMRPTSLVKSILHVGDDAVDLLRRQLPIAGGQSEFLDAFETGGFHHASMLGEELKKVKLSDEEVDGGQNAADDEGGHQMVQNKADQKVCGHQNKGGDEQSGQRKQRDGQSSSDHAEGEGKQVLFHRASRLELKKGIVNPI